MAEKNKGGRPTKYKEEYNEQAYNYCLLGADDKRLASFFDTTEQTINTWKHKHPKFLESLKAGKEVANANVARSLYERAMGYSHKEEKVFNNQGEIVVHEGVKHYPPDPSSAIFFLKNRDPTRWRDKQHLEHSGEINKITDEELNQKLQELLDGHK